MDFSAVPRPAFGSAAQHLPGATPQKVRAARRRAIAAKTAAELLPELPARGEALHCLMIGRYDLQQVVSAVVAGRPTRHLRIATLAYSRTNAAELLGLLEAKTVGTLTVLASGFFRSHNEGLAEWFAGELAAYPGSRVGYASTHCKVVCFDFGRADGLVFEGSANLRSNGSVREQLLAVRDRPLHDWHAAWIDDLVTRGQSQAEV